MSSWHQISEAGDCRPANGAAARGRRVLLLTLWFLLTPLLAWPGDLSLEFSRASAGGGFSAGGDFTLEATVGQAEAGTRLEGDFLAIDAGFLAGFLTVLVPSTNAAMQPLGIYLAYPLDGNWRFQFKFPTESGVTYQVQYKDTVVGPWKTAPMPIPGTGFPALWSDDGPPLTESLPVAARFYRAVGDSGVGIVRLDGYLVPRVGGSWKPALRFPTATGRTYFVQYKDDATAPWRTSSLTIIGTGTPGQWTDIGPPVTDSVSGRFRFYRLIADP